MSYKPIGKDEFIMRLENDNGKLREENAKLKKENDRLKKRVKEVVDELLTRPPRSKR